MTSEDMTHSPRVPPQAQTGRPGPWFDSDFHAPHAAEPRPCARQLARQPALPGRRQNAKGVVGAGQAQPPANGLLRRRRVLQVQPSLASTGLCACAWKGEWVRAPYRGEGGRRKWRESARTSWPPDGHRPEGALGAELGAVVAGEVEAGLPPSAGVGSRRPADQPVFVCMYPRREIWRTVWRPRR